MKGLQLSFCYWCGNLISCSLILLATTSVPSNAMGAKPSSAELQIVQQPITNQPDIDSSASSAAEKIYQEGLEFYQQGKVESLLKAIAKWEEALKLWRQAGNKDGESTALNDIAKIYFDLGNLRKALEYLNQALPLSRSLGDKSGEAIILSNIARIYYELGDKQKALSYYTQELPLRISLGEKSEEAVTLKTIANIYYELGNSQKALSYYNQALPLFKTLGNKGGEANVFNNIGNVYSNLGDKQKALSYFNQALSLRRLIGEKVGEATTLNSIGKIYDDLGEKQKALEYYNQVLPLRRLVSDKSGEATTLNNIGVIYSDLGEKQKALDYYNQALSLRRLVSDKKGEAVTLNNIGAVYSDLGEKQKALDYYSQVLPLRRSVGDKAGEATTLNNIGLIYSDLGEKQKTLDYYNQALTIVQSLGYKNLEATTLGNIGNVYYSLENPQKALDYYNQALTLKRSVGDKQGEAITLNGIGTVYDYLGNQQKALDLYSQSLQLIKVIGNKSAEAAIINKIGVFYFQLGEQQKAREYYNQALPLREFVGDRAGEAQTLRDIALLEQQQGNLTQALTQIQAAIKIIEDLRTKIASQELRTSYFASVQNYYQLYIDLLMQLHQQQPSQGYNALALHISERSRARSLVELLTEAQVDIQKGIDPTLSTAERRLQSLIDTKEKQLSELVSRKESPPQAIAAVKQQIENFIEQQRELEAKIRGTNSEYAALKYPQPLTLGEIQQQLDKETLLLEYSLGEQRSYLWVVSTNSVDSYQLPSRTEIETVASNFQKLLKKGLLGNAFLGETVKASQALSQIILTPAANQLENKRLVIVADGILHRIPFATLTDPATQPKTPDKYQPLILNHEIVSLPSVTSLATHRQKLQGRKVAPQTLAILADPVFSADDVRVTGKADNGLSSAELDLEQSALKRSANNLERGSWVRLEGTRQEAQAILKLVPASSSLEATDFDASYKWVSNPQLSQYQIIHFATHGILDMTNPELSGVILSLVDKQGKSQKGFLRLNDIFNLNLPAELVVLSACETGLGKEVKGEGVIGLTRGLMYAGSARVVVSLWKVDDQATSLLMTQFYRDMLQKGESPAAALRSAQLKLWQQQDFQAPYFWAAFTIQGEWR